jgi:hypothetical protein
MTIENGFVVMVKDHHKRKKIKMSENSSEQQDLKHSVQKIVRSS